MRREVERTRPARSATLFKSPHIPEALLQRCLLPVVALSLCYRYAAWPAKRLRPRRNLHRDGITFRGVEVPPEDDGGTIKSHAAIDAYFHADYVPVMDKEMRVLSYLPVHFVYLEPRASDLSAEVAFAD